MTRASPNSNCVIRCYGVSSTLQRISLRWLLRSRLRLQLCAEKFIVLPSRGVAIYQPAQQARRGSSLPGPRRKSAPGISLVRTSSDNNPPPGHNTALFHTTAAPSSLHLVIRSNVYHWHLPRNSQQGEGRNSLLPQPFWHPSPFRPPERGRRQLDSQCQPREAVQTGRGMLTAAQFLSFAVVADDAPGHSQENRE